MTRKLVNEIADRSIMRFCFCQVALDEQDPIWFQRKLRRLS
jgi:hypothetical protein